MWTVTRNGPNPSYKWYTVMYISTCRLPRRLSHAQRRGRTTQWTPRGDGGGRCPPRAAHRPPARHLCRSTRSERDIFLPGFIGLVFKGNPMEKSGRPVDSHEEWAGFIPMVVTRDTHLDLLTPSRPPTRSETRANDPLGIPRRWRGRWACYAPPAALRRLSLSPTSIGK